MEFINDCKNDPIMLFFCFIVAYLINLAYGNGKKENTDVCNDNNSHSNKKIIGLIIILLLAIGPIRDFKTYLDYSHGEVITKRIMLEKVVRNPISTYTGYFSKRSSHYNTCSFIYDSDGNKYLVANEWLETNLKDKLILKDYITIHYIETSRYDVITNIDGIVFR